LNQNVSQSFAENNTLQAQEFQRKKDLKNELTELLKKQAEVLIRLEQ